MSSEQQAELKRQQRKSQNINYKDMNKHGINKPKETPE